MSVVRNAVWVCLSFDLVSNFAGFFTSNLYSFLHYISDCIAEEFAGCDELFRRDELIEMG